MKRRWRPLFDVVGGLTLLVCLTAASPLGPPSSTKPGGGGGGDQLRSPPPKPTEASPKFKPIGKPELPSMVKPFGMPGVVGLQNGKWEGTDYLGFLTKNIGVSVEILKPEGIPLIADTSSIESSIASIFTKQDMEPFANVTEGPPLPFFHLLLVIYPVDQDKYVIFGNGRLFEQVQVVRKDFVPSGVWQGITWETQDVNLTNTQQLDTKVREMADKIATAFVQRYRQYNVSQEGMPSYSPSAR